jgi:hypothetical protein
LNALALSLQVRYRARNSLFLLLFCDLVNKMSIVHNLLYLPLFSIATPSARDLLLTTQWCASLGMIAAQWPDSTCEFF